MADLLRLYEHIERTAPLSPAAGRLLRLQSSPNHSLAEMAKVVELDPGLTVAVLKSANSAAASPAQRIVSVRQAVTYLGERMVLALAIAACVPGGMVAPLLGYQSERGRLWRHSLRTALAARALAQRCRPKVDAELAFTAGILHDVGKPVLSEMLQGQTESIVEAVEKSKFADFAQAERQLVGMCHAEVGEVLAQRWNLPISLRAAIRYHHEPSLAPQEHQPLAYAIQVADFVSMLAGDGTGADDLTYRLDATLTSILAMSRDDLDLLLSHLEREMTQALAMVEEP